MLTPRENKTGNGTCPSCGRKPGPFGPCRAVPLGWWCQQYGLAEDKSRWIHPSPDPVAVLMDTDPGVTAARDEEAAAQEVFDRADQVWQAALSELAAHRIRTGGGPTIMAADGNPHWQRPGRRRDRKDEETLAAAEDEARQVRQRTGEDLSKARERHRLVLVATRRALTAKQKGS